VKANLSPARLTAGTNAALSSDFIPHPSAFILCVAPNRRNYDPNTTIWEIHPVMRLDVVK
jgi:hypothetical protein